MAKLTEFKEVDYHSDPIPFGPRCPGPGIHNTWELAIEEGQVTLTSGCHECEQALSDFTNPESFEMEPIPVYLVLCQESYSDGHYEWWEMEPK